MINLLVVTARPNEEQDVGYRTISRPLIEAIENSQLAVNVELLRPGTYEALARHLEEKGAGFYHIIHFDTHGALMRYENIQKATANPWKAGTYHQLGWVAQDLREFSEARRNYQQALQIFIDFGDRYSSAGTYHQLGRVAQELREFDEARRNYQQALQIFIDFGDRYSSAGTYHQLGRVAQELREFSEARRNYQQALQIFIDFGDRYSSAGTYHCLGTLAEAEENYAEARANLQKALEIYDKEEYWGAVAQEILERLPE